MLPLTMSPNFHSPFSLLLSPVSHLLALVLCLSSPVFCLLYPISFCPFPVSCPISRRSSPVSRLSSPLSFLLSSFFCLLSPVSHTKCSVNVQLCFIAYCNKYIIRNGGAGRMKHPIPVQASRYMDCMYCTQWAGVIFKPKGLPTRHRQ